MNIRLRTACPVVSTATAFVLFSLAGCGGGGAESCPAGGGTGTLAVTITGAPATGGSVTAGGMTVATTGTLTLPAGFQDVTAARVAVAGATARTAYQPTIDDANPCVSAGKTTSIHVTYAVIPTSGKLWMGVGNDATNATALGYLPASVAATATKAADVQANIGGSDGLTFDAAGNIWVTGGTLADPPLARYSAGTFDTSGDKVPDIIIDSPSFAGGIPGARALAFDKAGNLWVTVVATNKVVRFTPEQLSVGGAVAASLELSGIEDPAGLAFDAAGNLYVSSGAGATVNRVDAAHLVVSGAGADATITAETPLPVQGTLPAPAGMAFDAAGSLWVNYNGTIARLTTADLAGTGVKTVTPAVQIGTDVLALPIGLAFDEEGGLWLASTTGTFARLAPSQLAASGTVAPATVITSPNMGYMSYPAIYPAPAFTPLGHRLP